MQLINLYNKTVLELKKVGIKSAELDVQVLLEEILEKDRTFTYTHPTFLITNNQYARFMRMVRRRKAGEPIAYILGHKEFYGSDFYVNKNVLVPRPETEWLVENSVKFINRRYFDHREESHDDKILRYAQDDKLNVIDVGTGSGCIILSVAKELNTKYQILNTCLYATDISPKAIVLARKNSKKLNSQKIIFYRSDLFSNRLLRNKKFDLIIANLPYVPHFKPKKNDSISYEPKDAIFAKDNGTATIKKFLKETKEHTCNGSLILLELDHRNAETLFDYAKKCYPNAKITLQKDLANLDRYLKIEN